MKRVLSLILALIMVIALTACNSSSGKVETSDSDSENSEMSEQAEIEIPEESSINDVIEDSSTSYSSTSSTEETDGEPLLFSELLNSVFEDLSSQVDVITFEDCIAYLDTLSFDYSSIQPDSDVMGQITVDDDNGFSLYAHFYPNGIEGQYTLTLLSYSNGNFGGTVSDDLHTGDVSFTTYDYFSEPQSTVVSSVEDIVSFMEEEVPSKVAEYEASISENEEINVEFDVSYEIIDKKVYFTINTNLPDNAVLMLTLSDGNYKGQAKVTVNNGVAISEGFGRSGADFSGTYTLTVSMSMARLQDDSVIAVIGTQGEFLTGEYVQSSESGNYLSGTFEVNF
ncbi:MAG: hypothetical protein LUE89_01150 [Clostridiales bacterium]|nr:hypothetical protein [Clostridiales bacterium]